MTSLDYLMAKIQKLTLPFKREEVEISLSLSELDPEAEISVLNVKQVDKIFMVLVFDLLISPDISEGEFSVKFDRKSMLIWYASECKRLEIDDYLNSSENVVKDMSYLS